ncbi:hypothetical protein HMPREF2935_00655 [Corynebacterium sp. HMSC076D02]|nr:hypothetical protein HMPREF2935_00655 [Corynebacterium sp. HMSC076D02]
MRQKFGTWFKSDEAGLTILALLTIIRGLSYVPPLINPARTPAHYLEVWASPTLWAAIWVTAGIFCLAATFIPKLLPVAVGLAVGLHAAWAMSFLMGTILGDTPRAWVSALNYLGVVFLALYAYGRERIQIPEMR